MNTQKLREEMKNDLTGKYVQEREFYDSQVFYDGYLKALLDCEQIKSEKYSNLLKEMQSHKWSGEE